MRRTPLLLGLVSVLLVAGCGSADDGGSSAPTGAPGGGGGGSSMGGGPGSGGSGGVTSPVAAGQLTAGDWDDNRNFAHFLDYVSQVAPQGDPLPALADRVLVRVTDPDGKPLANARVQIRAGTQALLDAPSASDGRVLFLPEQSGAPEGQGFSVTVTPLGGSPFQTVAPEGQAWEISVPGSERVAPNGLDLAFVVDTTGSMGDEIAYLGAEMDSIAEAVKQRFSGVSVSYGLVLYRDAGDAYVSQKHDFTSDLGAFKQTLGKAVADGGGDFEEAMHAGLSAMNQLSWRKGNVARVSFLIADAPTHAGADTSALFAQVAQAQKAGIKLYPVAASGTDDRAELLMRSAAFLTLSRYVFITDDSGIGGSHAEPHIPCYQVTQLNKLMIRMLYSELEGQLVPHDPADVIRSEGAPEDGVCTLADGSKAYLW